MRPPALFFFAIIAGCNAAQASDRGARNHGAAVAGFELGTRLSSASVSARSQSSIAAVEAAGEPARPESKERKVRVVYPIPQ